MARYKKMPVVEEGKIIYGDEIVDGIVALAVSEIPYVKLYCPAGRPITGGKAYKVKIDKDGVHVDVSIVIHYSQCVSDMAFKIQEAIRHNVEAMTEYHIASVNVIVRGVSFDDHDDKSATAPDVQEG